MNPEEQKLEFQRICLMVDRFTTEMKTRFLQKIMEGYRGWDDESSPTDIDLWAEILTDGIWPMTSLRT